MSVERIIVGVDGSQNAERALSWAKDLAGELKAEVIAVHAVGLIEGGTSTGGPLEAEPAVDDTVRRIIEHGDPVSVLLRIAQIEAADLIVVGSRGIGGHPGLLLGSTSTQVAQRADRPVVIVPHGDAEIAR